MPARSRPGLANSAGVVAGLIAVGLALRAYHYARNPAVWHDEAHTIVNLLHKGFGELFGALSTAATGPPLFLCLEKFVTLGLGDGTYALRLPSFLASCVGLFLFARLASQTLAAGGALGATLLVACSDRLLWHAAEARHYSSDFLIAMLLLLFLLTTNQRQVQTRAWLLAALAPLVIFSSYPGVFLCGGAFVALGSGIWRERKWGAGIILAGAIAGSFVAFYFITIRVQHTDEMSLTWLRTFPDWRKPWTLPGWTVLSTAGIFDYIGRPIGGVLMLPAIVGAVRWWRRGQHEFLFFAVVPMLLALTAALAAAYPYTGARTMIFAMPALALLVGSGVDALVQWRPRLAALRVLALLVIAIPLAATVGLAGYRTIVPWTRAATDLASTYVLSHRQAAEPVTANHWEYEYYFRSLGAQFAPELGGLAQTPRPSRVWVVISGHPREIREAVIASALQNWRIVERREFERTSVLLVTPH